MPETQVPQNEDVRKLLEPISETSPCGEDLWFIEGRRRLEVPLEESFKSGADPQWNVVCAEALDLMTRTRDLRAATVLCLAWFKLQGLPGMRNGLNLIHGLLEKYWDGLHPLPEGTDYSARSNSLSNLSAKAGSNTPYQFVRYLRATPWCLSAAGAGFSLADLERAQSGKVSEVPGAKPPATLDQIEAVFRASDKSLAQTRALITEMIRRVTAIEELVSAKLELAAQSALAPDPEKLGNRKVEPVERPDLANLKTVLARIDEEMRDRNLGGPAPQTGSGGETGKPSVSPEPAAGGFAPGSGIRSRAEAQAALTAVCDYFHRCEPSSPVPLLIDRALRLLTLDFLASVRELAPTTLESFHPLFGTKEPEPPEKKT